MNSVAAADKPYDGGGGKAAWYGGGKAGGGGGGGGFDPPGTNGFALADILDFSAILNANFSCLQPEQWTNGIDF